MIPSGPSLSPVRRASPKRLRGGALLGFVLGALFGLAVALGVAVYITKVPMPFMNKAQSRAADEAAEPKKDWDPNTGLPGRAAKPEAAPDAAAAAQQGSAPADPLGDLAKSRTEAKPEPKPEVKPEPKPEPKAEAKPEPKAEPKVEAKAEAKADPKAEPKPTAASDPFQYFVQAGAYRTPEDAEQQRAKLSLMGLQARITEREQAGRQVFRVRLGPFERRDEAEKTRERLVGSSIDAVVVRMQR